MKSDGRYWLGVDAGGTKTDLCLLSGDGQILSAVTVSGSNPSIYGEEAVIKTLQAARGKILEQAGLPTDAKIERSLFYVAGTMIRWSKVISQFWGFGEIQVFGDSIPVLELCSPGKPCAVIHAGTGSFVTVCFPDNTCQMWGGYGYKLNDPASGPDIGRRGLLRLAEEFEGLYESSLVGRYVQEQIAASELEDMIRQIYQSPDSLAIMSKCARAVTQAADEGDPVGVKIVTDSFFKIAEWTASVIPSLLKVAPEAPLGLSGKIFHAQAISDIMVSCLKKCGLDLPVKQITEPPIKGVQSLLMTALRGGNLPYIPAHKKVVFTTPDHSKRRV